jgi:UDP-glucose 4-epimerase
LHELIWAKKAQTAHPTVRAGAHRVKMLLAAGYHVVTLDNLSRGHRAAIAADRSDFVLGDIADRTRLDRLFADYT